MASPEPVPHAAPVRRHFNPLPLRIAVRAAALGILGFVLFWLLAKTQLYATALIVVLLMALAVADMAALLNRFDREVERLLQAFITGTVDVPPPRSAILPRATAAFEAAARRIASARTADHRRDGYRQALLDTVPAALFVLRADGSVLPANRAAQRLAAIDTQRLSTMPGMGTDAAAALAALPPGAQRIVKLEGGTQLLAQCGQFLVPGEAPARLLSLQRVTGDLDVVQMQAWADVTRVLAHEMMNSLTPIASLAESLERLLRNTASDDVVDALEAIRRRSQGLMSFVERYRNVAELPAPVPQRISLHELLSGIERLMAPALAERSITYARKLRPDDLIVRADPQLLEQALINLLRNAMDAAGSATRPEIELAAESLTDHVVLRITDNGPGLDASARDQLFVPFFTTKPGGSGVGLSLARHIALAHGGRLEAGAGQPTGAVFLLSLPN